MLEVSLIIYLLVFSVICLAVDIFVTAFRGDPVVR